MPNKDIEVKWISVDLLKPHPKNPNTHTKEQIERLAQILKYQGFRSPIIVSNLSGYITVGHGRLEAAKLNGWDKVPVSLQDYEDETQEYAHIVSDNSIADWATLDLSKINVEIPDLGPNLDLELLGLKNFTIDISEKIEKSDKKEKKPKNCPHCGDEI